jgi:type IV secretory pathway ATPase VirB11/archaellum biosynthesis ATPase
VLPPATTAGCVAITIRRPSSEVWSLEDLTKRGIFEKTRRATDALDERHACGGWLRSDVERWLADKMVAEK